MIHMGDEFSRRDDSSKRPSSDKAPWHNCYSTGRGDMQGFSRRSNSSSSKALVDMSTDNCRGALPVPAVEEYYTHVEHQFGER
jgi:hypothetical protein